MCMYTTVVTPSWMSCLCLQGIEVQVGVICFMLEFFLLLTLFCQPYRHVLALHLTSAWQSQAVSRSTTKHNLRHAWLLQDLLLLQP